MFSNFCLPRSCRTFEHPRHPRCLLQTTRTFDLLNPRRFHDPRSRLLCRPPHHSPSHKLLWTQVISLSLMTHPLHQLASDPCRTAPLLSVPRIARLNRGFSRHFLNSPVLHESRPPARRTQVYADAISIFHPYPTVLSMFRSLTSVSLCPRSDHVSNLVILRMGSTQGLLRQRTREKAWE